MTLVPVVGPSRPERSSPSGPTRAVVLLCPYRANGSLPPLGEVVTLWSMERVDRHVLVDRGGEPGQRPVAVAEQVVDRGQPAGVVADLVLGGDADPAVQLDRLLADVPRRAAGLQPHPVGCRHDVAVGV